VDGPAAPAGLIDSSNNNSSLRLRNGQRSNCGTTNSDLYKIFMTGTTARQCPSFARTESSPQKLGTSSQYLERCKSISKSPNDAWEGTRRKERKWWKADEGEPRHGKPVRNRRRSITRTIKGDKEGKKHHARKEIIMIGGSGSFSMLTFNYRGAKTVADGIDAPGELDGRKRRQASHIDIVPGATCAKKTPNNGDGGKRRHRA